MIYIFEFYTEGGCRGNGRPGAIGAAAAAVLKTKYGYKGWKKPLASDPTPTNQRAEIAAVVIAFSKALELCYEKLDKKPDNKTILDATSHSDSRYAVGCMPRWKNRFTNGSAMAGSVMRVTMLRIKIS